MTGLVHESVFAHAKQRPDAIAIEEGERRSTYGEIAYRALSLAATLAKLGHKRGEPIAFILENGIEACVAMCGILRADGCYVPLPPSWPAHRAGLVVSQVDPQIVITCQKHLDLVEEILREGAAEAVKAVVVLDAPPEGCKSRENVQLIGPNEFEAAKKCPCQRNVSEDLAYILFTSGTTGIPKGVMVRHRNVMNFLVWACRHFALHSGDRISNHSSLSFDLSVFDVWGAFFVGATSVPLVTAKEKMLPALFIRDRKITVWFSVPGVISMMRRARQLFPDAFTTLRHAIFCGEAMTNDDARAWIDANPDTPLTNLYGPTEATVACSVFPVTKEGLHENRPVSIGKAIEGNGMFVLDSNDALASPGEIGRLMVSGAQVTAGYWKQPDATAKAFVSNPLGDGDDSICYDTGDLASVDDKGCVHYVGRADSQIKFMGYRVELSEIEAVLTDCPGVLEASAILLDDEFQEIVGALSVDPANGVTDDMVFSHCESRLPSYMIPRRLFRLPDMPRNINGKIDRRAVGKIVGKLK